MVCTKVKKDKIVLDFCFNICYNNTIVYFKGLRVRGRVYFNFYFYYITNCPLKEKQLMTETDRELEKYYEDMLTTFRTDGWKTLTEDLHTNAEGINSVEATKDEKDLYFRKGQLYVISTLLNLEEHVRDAYDRLGEDPDAAL